MREVYRLVHVKHNHAASLLGTSVEAPCALERSPFVPAGAACRLRGIASFRRSAVPDPSSQRSIAMRSHVPCGAARRPRSLRQIRAAASGASCPHAHGDPAEPVTVRHRPSVTAAGLATPDRPQPRRAPDPARIPSGPLFPQKPDSPPPKHAPGPPPRPFDGPPRVFPTPLPLTALLQALTDRKDFPCIRRSRVVV